MLENSIDKNRIDLEKKILDICRHEFEEFFKYPNVVGVGYGYKEVRGKNTDIQCLKVMVKEKTNSLKSKDKVPELYKEIPTDVIQTGEIYVNNNDEVKFPLPSNFVRKYRPMKFGYSIGSLSKTAKDLRLSGSSCCLVTRGTGMDIKYYILSTAYVMSVSNRMPAGTKIVQPALSDGGTDKDVVATYVESRKFEPLNEMDAALALVEDINLITPEIAFMPIPKGVNNDPIIGETVQRSAKDSGYWKGSIKSTGVTVILTYRNGLKQKTINQILTYDPTYTPYSDTGTDAGSCILDESNRVVGMLIGNSKEYGVATPIKTITDYFKVDVYTQTS